MRIVRSVLSESDPNVALRGGGHVVSSDHHDTTAA